VKASGSALDQRLSVFWGTPATLGGQRRGGRFPPLDRLDLLDYGRLLTGQGSRALIRKCFTDLGVVRVVAHTMTVNQPSRRVMEKCGLTLVRSYHSDDVPDIPGADQGEVQYALTREWFWARD
jgi:hypothetical protein